MQNNLIFNLRPTRGQGDRPWTGAPVHRRRRWHGRRGGRGRTKTGRGGRGESREMLTSGGNERDRPGNPVNADGLLLFCGSGWASSRVRCCAAGAGARVARATGRSTFVGTRARQQAPQGAARCGPRWALRGPTAAEQVGSSLGLGPIR
jgi:hypothetical protein